MAFSLKRRPGVAVVEIYGVIGTRVKDSAYSRLFESIARNKRYGALLLDIDSPGGSATGSDLLYHSLKRVGESKPVVAYVRGLGASGGYYLCCAASRVFTRTTRSRPTNTSKPEEIVTEDCPNSLADTAYGECIQLYDKPLWR